VDTTVSLEIYAFALGLIVGSFLNVVILRYNTGKSLHGRSACFSCGHKLYWYELIPLGSFLLQGGRCRACGSFISLQYPLIELFSGILWWGVAIKVLEGSLTTISVLSFLMHALFMSALVVIFAYDLRHKIIPDLLVLGAGFLALLLIGIDYVQGQAIFQALIAGPLVAFPLYAMWLFSKGRAMGFGDVKLALVMGWFLGLEEGFTALLFSFWIGALVSVGMLLLSRSMGGVGSPRLFLRLSRLTMKSEVPFAPFLLAGLLVTYFFDLNLVALLF
jgi:prepilin signal peptidase PulO-like enzyme (type II secretory pathway)